jgi:hypothetical protein
MRSLKLWLAVVAALSLVGASAAVAWHKHGRTHTDPVTTSLTAAQAEITNKTCTGEDGNYRQFHGRWTGSANTTGDPRLRGTLKLYARGLINTTTKSGQVTGWLSIRSDRGGAKARFWAVHSNGGITGGGRLSGFVDGWVHDRTGATVEDQAGSGRLLGTLAGTLLDNGTLNAAIGGTAPAAAANIQGGGCRGWHDRKRKGR